MINNLAYTPILRYSDNRNSLSPNTVSAKSQRTGLTVKPDDAEKFAKYVIETSAARAKDVVTNNGDELLNLSSVFKEVPNMAGRFVRGVQETLKGFAELPDSYSLEATGAEDSPFRLQDHSGRTYTPNTWEESIANQLPTLFSPKPKKEARGSSVALSSMLIDILSGNKDCSGGTIFDEVHPGVDNILLRLAQSKEATQAIPAFDSEVVGKKTMEALKERGLIP